MPWRGWNDASNLFVMGVLVLPPVDDLNVDRAINVIDVEKSAFH